MFWTKSIKAAAIALGLGMAGTALAGPIVIRSDGPSKAAYPPGKALGTRVTLARGDTVVVIDGRGTRTLTGPGTIDLTARAGAAPSALTSLIANAGGRQVRTGAVRGGPTATVASPSLWYVDTARGGTVCLADLTRATLWRTDASAPVTLTLTRVSDNKSAEIAFAAKQNVRSWPVATLGLAEGTDYRLSGPGMTTPVRIRFAKVAMAGGAPEEVAGVLIGKGCMGQVDQLVEAGRGTPAG